jgi:hypothetical protein
MSGENRPQRVQVENGLAGAFWFAGWLFTLAYTQLVWWQALLGLVIWPYYLGMAVKLLKG